jgi:hypothetical protein
MSSEQNNDDLTRRLDGVDDAAGPPDPKRLKFQSLSGTIIWMCSNNICETNMMETHYILCL